MKFGQKLIENYIQQHRVHCVYFNIAKHDALMEMKMLYYKTMSGESS